jgi:hypothetical protein
VRLIGKSGGKSNLCEGSLAAGDGAGGAMGPRGVSECSRRKAELLAKAATHAAGMHLISSRPMRDAKLWVSDQIGRQHIRPIFERRLTSLQPVFQRAHGPCGTALRQAHNEVKIVALSYHRSMPTAYKRQHQYLCALCMKAVEVALITLMNDHIALGDAMAPGVTGLDITAAQDECGVCGIVPMSMKDLFCGIPKSARCGHRRAAIPTM